MRKHYTYKFISNNWHKDQNLIINELCISDKNGDDIDAILLNIKELIKKYQAFYNNEYDIAINESIFDKLLNKAKNDQKSGISSAEYVAQGSGYTNKSKSDKSYYDKSYIIEIILDDGNKVNGIIRISDHYVDLQKWVENNKAYDFGISFVIQETTSEWQGNNIVEVPNRSICIFEYVYEYKRENIRMLDQLISEILMIKKTRKYISNKIILGKRPACINSSLIEKIMIAIKEGLKEI